MNGGVCSLYLSVLTAARIAIIIAIISYPDGHLQRVHDSDGVYGGAEKGRGPKCNCTAPRLSRAALGLGHLGPSIDTRFKLNLNPLEGVRPGSDFIRLSSDWAASSSV